MKKDVITNQIKISLDEMDYIWGLSDYYDQIFPMIHETILGGYDQESITDDHYKGFKTLFAINNEGIKEAYFVMHKINGTWVYFGPEDSDYTPFEAISDFVYFCEDNGYQPFIVNCSVLTKEFLDAIKGNANERRFVNLDQRYYKRNINMDTKECLFIQFPSKELVDTTLF